MMLPRLFPLFLAPTLYGSLGLAHTGDTPAEPLARKTVFGVLLHDRGPFSDDHESGVDPNWELQFNPPNWSAWRWLGSPTPMLGVTPNFTGDTSAYRFSMITCRTRAHCPERTKASITSASVITFCSIADDDFGGSLKPAGT